jgi:hypothetical protein
MPEQHKPTIETPTEELTRALAAWLRAASAASDRVALASPTARLIADLLQAHTDRQGAA